MFFSPCVYLQWQVKELSNLQTAYENVVNKAFVCDVDRLSSWRKTMIIMSSNKYGKSSINMLYTHSVNLQQGLPQHLF